MTARNAKEQARGGAKATVKANANARGRVTLQSATVMEKKAVKARQRSTRQDARPKTANGALSGTRRLASTGCSAPPTSSLTVEVWGNHHSRKWLLLEACQPKQGWQEVSALSLDVIDVATGNKKSVAVDPALIEAVVGIQTGVLKKVQDNPSMDLEALRAALNTFTDYEEQP